MVRMNSQWPLSRRAQTDRKRRLPQDLFRSDQAFDVEAKNAQPNSLHYPAHVFLTGLVQGFPRPLYRHPCAFLIAPIHSFWLIYGILFTFHPPS